MTADNIHKQAQSISSDLMRITLENIAEQAEKSMDGKGDM
jgi:hypothetical protein